MRFTDKTAVKLLEKVKCGDLECHIDALVAEDIGGRSDIQVLFDEAEYLHSMYFEDGTCFYDEYHSAKSLLTKTKNGKLIPISIETFRPLDGYAPDDIKAAKEYVNMVGRLGRLVNKLNDMIWQSERAGQ